MSDPFISPILIAPGISDERNRVIVAAFSAELATFTPSTLVVQDAFAAPSALLPMMVVEAGMTDFVSADMREDMVRSLIDAAPEIHAMSGTIKGVRRALAALGISARWTQWWQEEPKAHHDTHKVVLYVTDSVINNHGPLDIPAQRAVARVIAATKRESQDIAIQYGMRGGASVFVASTLRRGRSVRISAPRLGDEQFPISLYVGIGAHAMRTIRINAEAA